MLRCGSCQPEEDGRDTYVHRTLPHLLFRPQRSNLLGPLPASLPAPSSGDSHAQVQAMPVRRTGTGHTIQNRARPHAGQRTMLATRSSDPSSDGNALLNQRSHWLSYSRSQRLEDQRRNKNQETNHPPNKDKLINWYLDL